MILLRLFKNNRMAGIVGIFFLTLALFVVSIVRAEEISGFTAMPFYKLIFGSIHNTPVLNRIVALGFILFLGYMLIRIGARYVLLEIRSFMPALFFIIFTAALPETQQVSPALVGSVFYLFSFAILFDVSDKPADTDSVFTAGIILALGSMFYLKLIWFLPLMWISLATLRTVTWRELLYPVFAFLSLALFLFTWYWGVMDNGARFMEVIGHNLAFERSYDQVFQPWHFSVFIYYGFFLLMVITASIYMINHFRSRKTVVQNLYQVLFYMFIVGILFFTLITRFEPASLVYIIFPVSYVLTHFLNRKRSHWFHELIMWIMIGLLVYVQWMV